MRRLIETFPALQHDPNQTEDVLKPDADRVGGDDAADALRYLVAAKSREVRVRKLRCEPPCAWTYVRLRLRSAAVAKPKKSRLAVVGSGTGVSCSVKETLPRNDTEKPKSKCSPI